jgi:hypothetical protein
MHDGFFIAKDIDAKYDRQIRGYRKQGRGIVIFQAEQMIAYQPGYQYGYQRDECYEDLRFHDRIFKG